MINLFITFLALLPFSYSKYANQDSSIDVITFKQYSIRGKFLRYVDSSQVIYFYNMVTGDTDIVYLERVNLLFYDTLKKSNYDTLYTSFKHYLVGKIFYKSPERLVFWDSNLKRIQVIYYPDFLNFYNNSDRNSLIFNPMFYSSMSFLSLIFSISLLLSNDIINSLIFLLLSIFALWAFFYLKTKIRF